MSIVRGGYLLVRGSLTRREDTGLKPESRPAQQHSKIREATALVQPLVEYVHVAVVKVLYGRVPQEHAGHMLGYLSAVQELCGVQRERLGHIAELSRRDARLPLLKRREHRKWNATSVGQVAERAVFSLARGSDNVTDKFKHGRSLSYVPLRRPNPLEAGPL
jgi:hypothetical protein